MGAPAFSGRSDELAHRARQLALDDDVAVHSSRAGELVDRGLVARQQRFQHELVARLETFMEFGYTEEQARALRKFVDAINGDAHQWRRLLSDLDVVKAFAKWGPHAKPR